MKAEEILKLRHSPIHNYAIPGLTSWLIGSPSEAGTVRLFEMTRHQHQPITPHSHRFPLYSYVLEGSVENILWERSSIISYGDTYQESELVYAGGPGEYFVNSGEHDTWMHKSWEYKRGSSYSMGANDIHSIVFKKGALLLVFEGATVSDRSTILEPVCYGNVVPTFAVEDWMFQRPPVPAKPKPTVPQPAGAIPA